MVWTNKLFRKRDLLTLIIGVAVIELLGCLLINRFMFHPVKDGYDKTVFGYVDIGTNGTVVAARIIGPVKGDKVLVYCHGNAEDITSIDGHVDFLTAKNFTVATVDYPGYGLSDGSPNESGCYRNAQRLYDFLTTDRGFAPQDVFVAGYSIGTGVAIDLAVKNPVGGLWLEAPYLSAPRIVTKIRVLPLDPFPNMEKIKNVRCPIVMVHGTLDSVVPYSHGRKLFKLAPAPKWFFQVENAGHFDFIDFLGQDRYEDLLTSFLQFGHL